MTKSKHKHDALAKQFLTDISIAQEFLTQYLPYDILVKCNLNSLVIESGSYIENDLRSHYSDILYKVNLIDPTECAYVYVLVEHQSSPELLMPLRIIKYQLAIIQKYLDKHNSGRVKLPLVVPLVFYNGRRSPYPYPCDIKELFANKELYDKAQLGKFNLVDLTIKEDNELLKHGKLAVLEILAKHIYARDFMSTIEVITQALKIGYNNRISEELINGAFSYLIYAKDTEEIEILFNRIKTELPKYEENIMTYAEELLRRGRQEGEQRGLQQGKQEGVQLAQQDIAKQLIKDGIDEKTVSRYTHLTIEQIQELKKIMH